MIPEQIGMVVPGEGSGTNKKTYNGKEYDYLFDIDIEDGKPPLKLPYNASDDPWVVARKFLEDNNLSMNYYDQVANWITANTQGAMLGKQEQRASDPWGTDRRYRPGDAGRKLPQRTYVTISEGNAQNGVNKLAESSKSLQSSGKLDDVSQLGDDDVAALNALAGQLTNNPQDPHPTDAQIAALLTASSKWPTKERVPAIALLARLAVSPSFVSSTSSGDKTIIGTLASAGLFEQRQETANNVVHAIRLLVNMFASDSGRLIMDGEFKTALHLARPYATEPESPAQYKALAALYLNYAVLLTSSAPTSESASREARAEVLLRDIAFLLECDSPHATDGDALYRILCALGTLLALGGDFRAQNKADVGGTLHIINSKPGAQQQNVKEIVQEIRDELR
jgi:phospholipase A-2-activating protein